MLVRQPIDRLFRFPIELYSGAIVIGFARLLKVTL